MSITNDYIDYQSQYQQKGAVSGVDGEMMMTAKLNPHSKLPKHIN